MLQSTTHPLDGMLKVVPLLAELLPDGTATPRRPWAAGEQSYEN